MSWSKAIKKRQQSELQAERETTSSLANFNRSAAVCHAIGMTNQKSFTLQLSVACPPNHFLHSERRKCKFSRSPRVVEG